MRSPADSRVKNAVRDAKRAALIDYIRTHPTLTLGEIVKLGDGLGALGKSISIAEVVDAQTRTESPREFERGVYVSAASTAAIDC